MNALIGASGYPLAEKEQACASVIETRKRSYAVDTQTHEAMYDATEARGFTMKIGIVENCNYTFVAMEPVRCGQ